MITVDDLAADILLSPDELACALAEHERRAAVLALAVSHVKQAGRWGETGAVSMRAWMRDTCRMSDRDAGAWLRRSRLLDSFTEFADAAVTGVLSSSHLAALERLNSPRYADLLGEHQNLLVGELSALSGDDAGHACTLWAQRADAVLDDGEPPAEPVRSLSHTTADDGAGLGRYLLDPAANAEWTKAIDNAITWEGDHDTRTMDQRRGDAMFDIAAFFNKNHDGAGTPRHHPQVGLSVNASTLAGTPQGVDHDNRPMDPACVDARLCDCLLHTIMRDDHDIPYAFGRATYTVPKKLFRQIAARDSGCRFPGCNRTVRYCDAHHIHYWRHHGPTDYDNLVLLCSRHHHLVHQQHLHLKLLPNSDLHVVWHTGQQRISQPRGNPPRHGP